jgi:hypothetical protein
VEQPKAFLVDGVGDVAWPQEVDGPVEANRNLEVVAKPVHNGRAFSAEEGRSASGGVDVVAFLERERLESGVEVAGGARWRGSVGALGKGGVGGGGAARGAVRE